LDDLKITKLAKQKAFTLSGGERRRLEITRALVNQPELILLDEPFSGVDPLAVSDIQEIIKDLRDSGLSILITDHSVRETLSIVDRAYLQFDGQILTQGESSFLINDEKSRKFYLGDNFTM
jgi:lipopolysaccharide export system ATP-binding protein